jgi:hypothetical protein
MEGLHLNVLVCTHRCSTAAIVAESRMMCKNMEMMGQRGTEGDKEWKRKNDES